MKNIIEALRLGEVIAKRCLDNEMATRYKAGEFNYSNFFRVLYLAEKEIESLEEKNE